MKTLLCRPLFPSQCLQRDLACLEKWSDTWLLKFHLEKCKILTVVKLENIQRAYPYRLIEVQLEHVFEEKDLGIIIDTDLTFDVHVSENIKKANNMLGLIRRSFCCLNADILLPLYKAFVCHLVEYGVDREMIEGMSYIDYGERLKLLCLPTLSYRRARGEMIELWKHYHVYNPKVITPTFQRARTRRKMYQIQRLRPGDGVWGAIVLLLLSSPSRMEQPPRLSSGVGYYQYIQESFWSTIGKIIH